MLLYVTLSTLLKIIYKYQKSGSYFKFAEPFVGSNCIVG